MRDKAKSGDLKVMNGSEPKQKIGDKKKRRWDQAAGGGGDDTPAKKKASTWDQAEVGTPSHVSNARSRSPVGNVSGYRWVSDCRSRGREFVPGPVRYFRGD